MADNENEPLTLELFGLQLADVVAECLIQVLHESNYFGYGDEDLTERELPSLARGAVSDKFEELIDRSEDPSNEAMGWSDQLKHLPLEEALHALQSVRHVNREPIRNAPQPPSGRRRRKRKGGRRRKRSGVTRQQSLPGHPDEDPDDPSNYDPMPNEWKDPFYASENLSPDEQDWLARQAEADAWRDQR